MKIIPIKKVFARVAFIMVILCGSFSCKQSDNMDLPVLDMEKLLNKEIIIIDDAFRNYWKAESNFLKNSSSLNPDDIRNVKCIGNDLFLLFPEDFLHYDLVTGDLLFRYQSSEPADFIDFAFEPSTQNTFILDNKSAKVIELSVKGKRLKSEQLDTTFTYAMIKRLADHFFLIPKQTVPSPAFTTVDFKKDEIKEYKFQEGEKTRSISSGSDSVWAKYPLYVADEIPSGVMIKYLFNDNVFLCTADHMKPNYKMNMGRQRVKRKYPWAETKFKNNDRARIIGFWHRNDKKYVIVQQIIKNELGTYDYKTLYKLNDLNADNSSGFIVKVKLASLDPNHEPVFMDDAHERFFSIRKLNEQEKKEKERWPENMLGSESEDDMVVSVFTMK